MNEIESYEPIFVSKEVLFRYLQNHPDTKLQLKSGIIANRYVVRKIIPVINGEKNKDKEGESQVDTTCPSFEPHVSMRVFLDFNNQVADSRKLVLTFKATYNDLGECPLGFQDTIQSMANKEIIYEMVVAMYTDFTNGNMFMNLHFVPDVYGNVFQVYDPDSIAEVNFEIIDINTAEIHVVSKYQPDKRIRSSNRSSNRNRRNTIPLINSLVTHSLEIPSNSKSNSKEEDYVDVSPKILPKKITKRNAKKTYNKRTYNKKADTRKRNYEKRNYEDFHDDGEIVYDSSMMPPNKRYASESSTTSSSVISLSIPSLEDPIIMLHTEAEAIHQRLKLDYEMYEARMKLDFDLLRKEKLRLEVEKCTIESLKKFYEEKIKTHVDSHQKQTLNVNPISDVAKIDTGIAKINNDKVNIDKVNTGEMTGILFEQRKLLDRSQLCRPFSPLEYMPPARVIPPRIALSSNIPLSNISLSNVENDKGKEEANVNIANMIMNEIEVKIQEQVKHQTKQDKAKEYKCKHENCPCKFKTSLALARHMKNHLRSTRTSNDNNDIEDKRPYKRPYERNTTVVFTGNRNFEDFVAKHEAIKQEAIKQEAIKQERNMEIPVNFDAKFDLCDQVYVRLSGLKSCEGYIGCYMEGTVVGIHSLTKKGKKSYRYGVSFEKYINKSYLNQYDAEAQIYSEGRLFPVNINDDDITNRMEKIDEKGKETEWQENDEVVVLEINNNNSSSKNRGWWEAKIVSYDSMRNQWLVKWEHIYEDHDLMSYVDPERIQKAFQPFK